MENQHRLIKGYRELSQDEIDLMNEGKALAEKVGAWIAALENYHSVDPRWRSIGATQLQQGFMAAIRSIAKPETF